MTFAELTWEDLREWAGARVVTRGKGYRRAVEDLRLAGDGRLLACLQGSDRYATVVRLTKSGRLSSVCTCPYGIACKHAVATVLAYLDKIQSGEPVPAAQQADERFARLAEERGSADADNGDDETPLLSAPAGKQRLKRCAPPILYGAGDRALLSKGGLAVVGSRHIDAEAEAFARAVGRRAAQSGMQLISGAARGRGGSRSNSGSRPASGRGSGR